ncbi:MAG: acetyl-CoA carboxylase biotin carboxyl carrier protein subunit [Sneathiellaceae bacterium]
MAAIEIKTEVTGKVWKIVLQPGATVAVDDEILILESMKMEIPVVAPAAGMLKEIKVAEGDSVAEDDVVAIVDA